MIFEIDKIDEEGQSFEVLESKQHFNIDSPDCVLTEDVKIQGRLVKIDQEILCQGLLETGLSVTCTRCLIGFSFPVSLEGDLAVCLASISLAAGSCTYQPGI